MSKDVLAVGISQRTDADSIENSSSIYLKEALCSTKKVLNLNLPIVGNSCIWTLFSPMVDYDKFTIHPEIEGKLLCVFSVTYENEELHIEEEHGDLLSRLNITIASNLGVEKVDLIRCGDENIVAAGREQWNDGSNTLTITSGLSWCTNEIPLPMLFWNQKRSRLIQD